MSLTVFKSDNGVEILIDRRTGESFCSVNGYARMSGKDKSVISRRLKFVAPGDIQSAEILTASGMQRVVCFPIKTAFQWASKDNLNLAVKLKIHFPELKNMEIGSISMTEKKPSDHIYCIGDPVIGVCKIGITNSLAKRFKDIQTSYPYDLSFLFVKQLRTRNPRDIERVIHGCLVDLKLRGEWFDILAFQLIDWGAI